MSEKKVRIGIVGFGSFSLSHLEIFMAHPDVEKVVGAEILDERRKFVEEKYKIKMYKTYDEMLEKEPDLNSVGVFAQRHQHGPLIIQGLKAGKNVFTAVPMGCTVDEVFEILDLVEKTGLTFAMGETCYYFPCAIWNRKRIKEGVLGDVTYGEAQYYHNITEFLDSYKSSGENANREIGIPPMLYGTHSASMLISSIGSSPVEITCFGYVDKIGDGFYGKGVNNWDNPFSNQTAIVRFKNGAIGRLNEFRRIGSIKPSSFITGIYGTKGTYECSGNQHLLTLGNVFGQQADSIDVSDEINTFSFIEDKGKIDPKLGRLNYKYHTGFSPIQNTARLPEVLRKMEAEFRKKESLDIIGHNGTHFFNVDDFVKAVVMDKLPPINAWRAAEFTLTGILANESAVNNNKTIKFPEVGNPPSDKEVLDFD
ncbi:MAG: Gfo/Idh/MocA family oxidoreductase [Clostridia bacterium]|nr:Gfo/Idh/MocA family oxidoreductase [Clostridia bacterium]